MQSHWCCTAAPILWSARAVINVFDSKMPIILVSLILVSLKSEWIAKLKGTLFYSSSEADVDTHLMAALKLRTVVFLWMFGLCKWIRSSVPQIYHLKHVNSPHFPVFFCDALKLPFAWFWTLIQLMMRNSAVSHVTSIPAVFFSVVPVLLFQQCFSGYLTVLLHLLTIKMSIQYKLVFWHWWQETCLKLLQEGCIISAY